MLVQTFPVLLDVDDELKNDHPRENRGNEHYKRFRSQGIYN